MDLNYRPNSAVAPEGELQQAHGSVYVSDVIRKMKEAGIEVDAATYRRVRDKMMARAAAEQEAYAQNYEQASRTQARGMAQAFSLNPLDITRGITTQQIGTRGQRVAPPRMVLDDIAPGEAGDYARRMRAIRDGEIKVEESHPAMQVLDTGVRTLTQVGLPFVGGRVTLGVERDPTKEDSPEQRVAEQAAGLLGMGGNVAATVALFKGAGLGAAATPAAVGANMAFQEGRRGTTGRLLGFAEGASLGTTVAGFGAVKSMALRKMAGETGSARMAVERFIRSTP